jgi:hypothetical protein
LFDLPGTAIIPVNLDPRAFETVLFLVVLLLSKWNLYKLLNPRRR